MARSCPSEAAEGPERSHGGPAPRWRGARVGVLPTGRRGATYGECVGDWSATTMVSESYCCGRRVLLKQLSLITRAIAVSVWQVVIRLLLLAAQEQQVPATATHRLKSTPLDSSALQLGLLRSPGHEKEQLVVLSHRSHFRARKHRMTAQAVLPPCM